MAARRPGRRNIIVAALLASMLVTVLVTPASFAAPTGNDNWTILDATCDGQPVQLLDPRGGKTAFLIGGTVGVGKRFRYTNLDTGQVLEETVNGAGVSLDRLTYCTVLLPDMPSNILFEAWVMVTPQGH